MRNDQNDRRRASPKENLSALLTFLNDDPTQMSEAELDAYLSEAGLDFEKFNTRLTNDLDVAVRKARLIASRSERATFFGAAKHVIDLAAMTLDQKRTEIQARLGLLSGNAALVYNRNYENVEDEDDLDDLLSDLRSLDERAGGDDGGA